MISSSLIRASSGRGYIWNRFGTGHRLCRPMGQIAKSVLSGNSVPSKTTAAYPGGTCGFWAIRMARWSRMNIATAIAQSGVTTMLADIHGFASYIHELRGKPELMRARAEARLRLSIAWGYPTGRALSEIYLGWADAIAGDFGARHRAHRSISVRTEG